MLFGLPAKYLPQALMWSFSGEGERRLEALQIPSWNWASFANQVRYSCGGYRNYELSNIASLVYFYFQDPESGLCRVNVKERWIDRKMAIEEFQTVDEVPEIIVKEAEGFSMEWTSARMWRESPHNPWQTLAHLTLGSVACSVAATIPGSLVFNTTVASLKLDFHWGEEISGNDELTWSSVIRLERRLEF
jgi:hypothetical protein